MQVLGIAATALLAAERTASIYAHNIANARTPDFAPSEPVYSTLGGLGGGAAVFAQDIADRPGGLIRDTLGLTTAVRQYKAAARLISTDEALARDLFRSLA